MDTLKKTACIAVIICIFTTSVWAQDYKAITDAFSSSYVHEYTGDYTKAIDALKKVNFDKSYEINLRLGWLTYMSGLFTESMSFYQKAISNMPYSVEAKLGFIYPAAALGNWEQVVKQYKDILKIDPQNPLANYRLGLIYYGREDFNAAYKYFEQLINLYPFDYNYNLYFAWTNFKLGKTREAKVLFFKTLMIQPLDASALEGLSLIK